MTSAGSRSMAITVAPVSPRRSSWRSVRPMTRESAAEPKRPRVAQPGQLGRDVADRRTPCGAPAASSPLCAASASRKTCAPARTCPCSSLALRQSATASSASDSEQDRHPLEPRQERLRDRHQRHADDQQDRDLQRHQQRPARRRRQIERLARRRARAAPRSPAPPPERAPSAPRPARTATAAPASPRSAPARATAAPTPATRAAQRGQPPRATAIRRSRSPPHRARRRGSAAAPDGGSRDQAPGARPSTRSPCTQAP